MSTVYCWRCKRFVKALNEAEYAQCIDLMKATKAAIEAEHRHEMFAKEIEDLRRALWEECSRLSGDATIALHHLTKHRAWMFGPTCVKCGKNLRTPHATKCMECGWTFTS